jgi:hypothetical protein
MSFLPPDELPRSGNIDDYAITLEPYSMPYRSPDERLALLGAAIGRITQVAQTAAAGVPVDLEKYIEIEAEYNGLPELRELYSDLLPEYAIAKQEAGLSVRRPGTGEYIRHNVSEGSNDAELQEGMNTMPSVDTQTTAANVG